MTIGPNFPAEIAAAGLMGLPFSWSPDGVVYGDALSEADRARIEAVVAAHDPAVPARLLALPDISDRQFGRGLWGDGLISYADFLGFIGPGTVPAPIQVVVDTLPDDDTGRPTPRKDAIGFLTGSKLYEFRHPLVEAFRSAMAMQDPAWTPGHLRERWLAWSKL